MIPLLETQFHFKYQSVLHYKDYNAGRKSSKHKLLNPNQNHELQEVIGIGEKVRENLAQLKQASKEFQTLLPFTESENLADINFAISKPGYFKGSQHMIEEQFQILPELINLLF